MKKIKGMLADDEVNILKNLRTVVPWEDLGIDIVAMAKDGSEAWEMYQNHQPELILCDIRMPVMDGIDFIKRIDEAEGQCEIIMLTGYKDFRYMRSSIQSGVRDYLLKPIDYDELRDVVERAASDIKVTQLKDFMEKKKWGDLAHLAYEKSLHDALMGHVSPSPWIWEGHKEDNQPVVYQLLVVDMDNYSQKTRFWNEADRKLWNFAVNNILSEALLEYGLSYTALQMNEGEWCICVERKHDSLSSIQKWAEKLSSDVHAYLNLTVSVGAFDALLELDQLSRAYKLVQRDLNLTSGKREKTLILTKDISHDENDVGYFLWDKVEKIVSAIKNNDREQAESILSELRKNLYSLSDESLVHVEQILHYLSLHLLREMKELGVIDADGEEVVWKNLKWSMGNEDLLNVIQQLANDSMNSLAGKKSSDILMIAAKDFIDRNIGSDIGIGDLAEHLEISASYFSMLFKQQFHETFVEYVTRRRMEQAQDFMITTNQSIQKIAKQLGYSDRRYFSKVFHKFAGVIPSEFREQHQR